MARATTKTAIANRTASLLKVDAVASIDPPDSGSKFAKKAAQWYDDARRETLQDHIWNFAETTAVLAADATAPAAGKYGNRYLLPVNYIRIAWIGDEDYPDEDYKIKDGYIHTNASGPLEIGYIYDQTDVSKFTPKFIKCLACKLAVYLAYDMTGNRSMVGEMEKAYMDALSTAATIDGQESPPPRKIRRSKWRAARDGRRRLHGYDGYYQGRVKT